MSRADEVARLARAIKATVATAYEEHESIADAWRTFTDECLRRARIELADQGEFERACLWMWRSAFMGGNYTQDARRVLTEARRVP